MASIDPTRFHWEKKQPDGTWARVASGPADEDPDKESYRKVAEKNSRWRARYRDPQNRTLGKTFRTKAEAKAFLEDLAAETRRAGWADPALGRTLFDTWAEEWFANRVNWRPSTRRANQNMYPKHIAPHFSGRKIADIDRTYVRRWISALAAQYSPKYVRNLVGALHGIFEEAKEGRAIRENPVSRQKLPEKVRQTPMFLNAEQVQRLVSFMPHPYSLAALVLAFAGLRPSEMTGLRIRNVDLMRGRLNIVETLTAVSGTLIEGPTKTNQHRSVPIPAFLVELLSAYLATRREAAGGTLDPNARLFVGMKSPHLREPWFQAKVLRPAAVKAGFSGLRAYDLRHSYASMLIATGAHPKVVQERMGHKSIMMTMDVYGHLFPALEQSTTDALDSAYRAVEAAPATPEAGIVSLRDRLDRAAELEAAPTEVELVAEEGDR